MDIVERLLSYRPPYGWPEEYSIIVEPTLNHVAADEIERLRKIIWNVLEACEDVNSPDRKVREEITRTVRKALKEKE